MAIREGAWDCPACGRERIRGPEKHCGSCGSPRGEDVPFYLPDDARVVEDAAEQARSRSGPDWSCSFCDGDNPGFNQYCSGCGSAKDPSKARAQTVHSTRAPAPAPPVKQETSQGGGCLKAALAAFVVILVLVVGFCVMVTSTTETQLTVSGLHWERAIEVERLATVTETGWRGKGEVPSDARVRSSSRKLREHRKVQVGSETRTRQVSKRVQAGTRKVKTGVKDLGNGYFEDIYEEEPVYEDRTVEESYQEPVYKEEPVYDEEVTYQVDRWKTQSTARSDGKDSDPRWPEVATDSTTRAGKRTESYEVVLTESGGKSYTYNPKNESTFKSFGSGQTVTASINRLGQITEVTP